MINVLPEAGRHDAKKEYALRLAALVCAGLGVSALLASLALFPVYLAGKGQRAALEEELALAEASLVRETENAALSEVREAGKAVPVLEGTLAARRPSVYIEEVLGVRGQSVRILRFEFQGGASSALRVSGEAQTRLSLTDFAGRLKQVSGTPRVLLPVGDLAKSEQASFMITLSFDP